MAKSIIWGIRVQEKVRTQWQSLAAVMRLPITTLVPYVLQDWLKTHQQELEDPKKMNDLADRIAKYRLRGRLR